MLKAVQLGLRLFAFRPLLFFHLLSKLVRRPNQILSVENEPKQISVTSVGQVWRHGQPLSVRVRSTEQEPPASCDQNEGFSD